MMGQMDDWHDLAAIIQRLEQYLAERIDGFRGPVRLERLPGGQSNPTYRLVTPTRTYAMRCKPGTAARLLPSAHAIEREFEVQSALAASEVPTARMYCLCEDESIIGRSFYVMDLVRGRIFWRPDLPELAPVERGAIYAEMNRVIAALHRCDFTALGLGKYGKPGNYFARQIVRWSRQYRASETQRIEAMERLIEWLPAHVPQERDASTAIVHGDFRIDNLIFHATEPRILAVIDWELSTLGHPLADFAYHTLPWSLHHDLDAGLAGIDLKQRGIPSEPEYWATYLQAAGLRVVGDRRFYLVYNLFRMASILQGIARRAQDGTASSAQAAEVARSARPRAELAWQLAQQIGD